VVSRLTPVLVLGATLLIAACSSSSDSSSGSATPLSNGSSNTSAASAGASSTPTATPQPNGNSPSQGQVTDACSLLTQAEVAAATGVAVGPGVSQNDGKQCMFEYTDPSDALSGLDASIAIDFDPVAFREDQQLPAGITAVTGIGDEAYFTTSGPTGLLDFRKGTLLFETSVLTAGTVTHRFPADAQQAADKAMALAALPRIP
jgi:hypothetical protein